MKGSDVNSMKGANLSAGSMKSSGGQAPVGASPGGGGMMPSIDSYAGRDKLSGNTVTAPITIGGASPLIIGSVLLIVVLLFWE
jgi:hypothetical protein